MDYQKLSDQELIRLYMEGQQAAFSELLNRYKDNIYTSIYLLVKDSYLAEDIFQEAFIKILNTIKNGGYSEEGKFLPWAIRIARNLVIDHFRRVKRQPTVSDIDGSEVLNSVQFYDESIEDKVLKLQSQQALRDLIKQLPEDQREVLIMRHYADLSFKEIADATNVSINTALGRMRYALNNLRKLIETQKSLNIAIAQRSFS
jgi:RNA polymerase sigma factor (sigma-70 family)